MQQAKTCKLVHHLEAIQIIQLESLQDYAHIYQKMRNFTLERNEHTLDEIWLLEHYPVFTQGQAGKSEHILDSGDIPIIQSDRGGQITYHGPGQIMIYLLLDLHRKNLGIRELINLLDQLLIELLMQYHIIAYTKPEAPGIYVGEAKIASIGLRVRKGCSYHGVCLNVEGDLSPFLSIHPCGYKNLIMTNIKNHIPTLNIHAVYHHLIFLLKKLFIS